MRRAVVLPQPEGPSSATSSPGAISSDSPSRARVVPNERLRFCSNTLVPPVLALCQVPSAAAAFLAVFVVIRLSHGLADSAGAATVNRATWAPPRLRAPRPPTVTMSISRSQVTNSASSEAAVETGPLSCSNCTIHTGKVT